MSAAFLAGVIAGYGVAVPVGGIAVLIAGLSARTSWRVGAAAGLGAATADGLYALLAVLGGAALAAVVAPIAVPLRWAAAATLLVLAGHTIWVALRKHRAAADERPGLSGRRVPTTPNEPSTTADERGASGERPSAGEDWRASEERAIAGDERQASGEDRRTVADQRAAGGEGLVAPERETLIEHRASARERASRAATPARAYAGILGLTLLNPATVGYFAALVMGRGGSGGGVLFVVGAFLASASWQLLIAASGALAGRLLTGERAQLLTAIVSSTVIAALAVVMVW